MFRSETFPNLHEGSVSEDLIDPTIDYTRPLSEYPSIDAITQHILSGAKPKHIYTKSLNQNGKVVQDSMEKYLSNESLSSSMLKDALKTPLHLKFGLDGDKNKLEKMQGEKSYFNIGTYLHQCILEPTKFTRAIVEPKHSLSSSEGVENLIKFWEGKIEEFGKGLNEKGEEITAQEALDLAMDDVDALGLSIEKQDGKKRYYHSLKAFSGMQAVTEENYFKIQILKKHYDNYGGGILKRLLLHSKREISVYAEDQNSGLNLKVRPDALQFKENIGVDAIISIKSTSKEDLNEFFKHAANLHYDLSEGMYQHVVSNATGRDFNTTITIMLQTVAPFAIAVLVWSPEDIETGKYKFRSALEITERAIKEDRFQGFDTYAQPDDMGLIQLNLPGWNNKILLPAS